MPIIGYWDFVVHIPEKYSQTFTTESGFTLHADRRFSLKMVANTIVKVVSVPFDYDGPIIPGQQVFIDPSVLMQQVFTKGGESPNIYLIDRRKHLYKVDPPMVLAYETEDGWIGTNGNVFVKRLPMPKMNSNLLEVVDFQQTGLNDKVARRGEVIIPMYGHECKAGDIVWFKNLYSIDMWVGNKELVNVRDKDLLAQEEAA